MKKILLLLGILLGLYLIAAVAAWFLLPEKINDANKRLFSVRMAISQLTHDQQFAADRMKAITDETLGRGKSKIDEVSALLGDPDLNHIALVYTGSDWSVQRSAFLGQVAHSRNLLAMQQKDRKDVKTHLNEKIEELEARKRTLMRRLQRPSDERAWRVEMDDIERQLVTFRSSNTYQEYLKKDIEESKHIEANARNEDALFKLASDYHSATVGRLNQILAERLGALRWEENNPVRWQQMGSWFNIWPLNLILKMPLGEDDEKRL